MNDKISKEVDKGREHMKVFNSMLNEGRKRARESEQSGMPAPKKICVQVPQVENGVEEFSNPFTYEKEAPSNSICVESLVDSSGKWVFKRREEVYRPPQLAASKIPEVENYIKEFLDSFASSKRIFKESIVDSSGKCLYEKEGEIVLPQLVTSKPDAVIKPIPSVGSSSTSMPSLTSGIPGMPANVTCSTLPIGSSTVNSMNQQLLFFCHHCNACFNSYQDITRHSQEVQEERNRQKYYQHQQVQNQANTAVLTDTIDSVPRQGHDDAKTSMGHASGYNTISEAESGKSSILKAQYNTAAASIPIEMSNGSNSTSSTSKLVPKRKKKKHHHHKCRCGNPNQVCKKHSKISTSGYTITPTGHLKLQLQQKRVSPYSNQVKYGSGQSVPSFAQKGSSVGTNQQSSQGVNPLPQTSHVRSANGASQQMAQYVNSMYNNGIGQAIPQSMQFGSTTPVVNQHMSQLRPIPITGQQMQQSGSARVVQVPQPMSTRVTSRPVSQPGPTRVANHQVPQPTSVSVASVKSQQVSQPNSASVASQQVPQPVPTRVASQQVRQPVPTRVASPQIPQSSSTGIFSQKQVLQSGFTPKRIAKVLKLGPTGISSQQAPQPGPTSVASYSIPQSRPMKNHSQQMPKATPTNIESKEVPKPGLTSAAIQQTPKPGITSITSQQIPKPGITSIVSHHVSRPGPTSVASYPIVSQPVPTRVASQQTPQPSSTGIFSQKQVLQSESTPKRITKVPKLGPTGISSQQVSQSGPTSVASYSIPQAHPTKVVKITSHQMSHAVLVSVASKQVLKTRATSVTNQQVPKHLTTSVTNQQISKPELTSVTSQQVSKRRATNIASQQGAKPGPTGVTSQQHIPKSAGHTSIAGQLMSYPEHTSVSSQQIPKPGVTGKQIPKSGPIIVASYSIPQLHPSKVSKIVSHQMSKHGPISVDIQKVPKPQATVDSGQQVPTPSPIYVTSQQMSKPELTSVANQQASIFRLTSSVSEPVSKPRAASVASQPVPDTTSVASQHQQVTKPGTKCFTSVPKPGITSFANQQVTKRGPASVSNQPVPRPDPSVASQQIPKIGHVSIANQQIPKADPTRVTNQQNSKPGPIRVASQHMLKTVPTRIASQLESTKAGSTVDAPQHTQHRSSPKTVHLSSTKPLQQVTPSLGTKCGFPNDARPELPHPTKPTVPIQHPTRSMPTIDESKLPLHSSQHKQVTSITARVNQAKQSKKDVLKMIYGSRKAKTQLTYSELIVEDIGGVKQKSNQTKQSQTPAMRKGADVATINKNLMVLVRTENNSFSLKTLQEHNKDLVKKPKMPIKCFFCQKRFKCKSRREIHILVEHDLCCRYCPTTCEDESALALHENKCRICKDVLGVNKGKIDDQKALTGLSSVNNGDKSMAYVADEYEGSRVNASLDVTGKNRNEMLTMGKCDVQQDQENIPVRAKSENMFGVVPPNSMRKTTKSADTLTENMSTTAANEGRPKQTELQPPGHIRDEPGNIISIFTSNSMRKTTKSADTLTENMSTSAANEGRLKQADLQPLGHIRDKSGNVIGIFPSISMGKASKSADTLTRNMSATAANEGRLKQAELQPLSHIRDKSENVIRVFPINFHGKDYQISRYLDKKYISNCHK